MDLRSLKDHTMEPRCEDGVEEFMQGSLVSWIKSFLHLRGISDVTFGDLADGSALHNVLIEINPQNTKRKRPSYNSETAKRTDSLYSLLVAIKGFYEDSLDQMLVCRLPDVVLVGKNPEQTRSRLELQQLMKLILGCAVQCEKRNVFIENITCLNIGIQEEIATWIQEVTENPETVWPSEWQQLSTVPEHQIATSYDLLIKIVKKLIQERDECYKKIINLVLNSCNGRGDCEGKSSPSKDDPDHGDSQLRITNGTIEDCERSHISLELAECKAKLRRCRQELEEKTEIVGELKLETEASMSRVAKLRQENLDLIQEARNAKTLRDELDIVREKASKVDRLEAEVLRFREKMSDIEFYKTRIDELRGDLKMLGETNSMLEEQLKTSRKRADQILDLESAILKYKGEINSLQMERDADKDRINELTEEVANLQFLNKSSLDESNSLSAELDRLKVRSIDNNTSLSEQIGDDALARARKLELENQRLATLLESLKESSFHESGEKILEVEKENKRLSLKVEQVQTSYQKEVERCLETQQDLENRKTEIRKLQDTLDIVRQNSNRQALELQREKQDLTKLVATLRDRERKTHDALLLDVENENKKLLEKTQKLSFEVSQLDYDNKQLAGKLEDKSTEVEELTQTLAAMKSACEKHQGLLEENSVLELDNKNLQKTLDNLKESCKKVDLMHQQQVSLTLERDNLLLTVETLKKNAQNMADLERDRDSLRESNNKLQKSLEMIRSESRKATQLELDLLASTTDRQKLQKTVESCNRKCERLERDNRDLESENSKLEKAVETLKVTNRRLNQIEKEITDLEGQNHRLEQENKSLTKEVNRLKQFMAIKDTSIDEWSNKASTLERSNRKLLKDLETNNAQLTKLQDVEKSHKELLQQKQADSHTLATLREDLVQEKLRSQQLNSRLQKIFIEFEQLGIQKEALSCEDISKGSLLELVKRAVCQHQPEGRNAHLEKQIDDLKHQNSLLQEELSLQVSRAPVGSGPQDLVAQNDRLVLLERENATLLSEKKSLSSSIHEQSEVIQSTINSLQQQNASLSHKNASLQNQIAKLQVDNTALTSQTVSQQNQISQIQAVNIHLENEKNQLSQQVDQMHNSHRSLAGDHDALNKLHLQLTSDYESLKHEQALLKSDHRRLKSEKKMALGRLQSSVDGQEDLEKLKDHLESEREMLKADIKSLSNLRAEHSRLKEDFRCLFTSSEKLKSEYQSLNTDYKAIKAENNALRLKSTDMQGRLDEANHSVKSLDVEQTKLINQVEMLRTINTTLEDERKSLMEQVTLLLSQYHDLLTQTLDDRQHFHNEEKNYTDKLNQLKRQKEKLEEKIIDQYRKMDSTSSKKKSFGANLVRRMRKAGSEIMMKVPRTGRSRDRTDSQDSASLGSSSCSGSNASDSETRKGSPQSDGECGRISNNTPVLNRQSLPPHASLFIEHQKEQLRSSLSSDEINFKNQKNGSDETISLHSQILQRIGDVSDCGSGNDTQSGKLSLGHIGTRRAVYYNDEHDTIPTRDVGPGPILNSSPIHSSSPVGSNPNSLSRQGSVRSNRGRYSNTPPIPRRRSTESPVPNGDLETKAPKLPPKPCVNNNRTVNSENNQTLPKKPPSDKEGEKVLDNSVWYEYGCV